jgi:hypothetical protein
LNADPMKRTLLAVGIAIILSMMLVPFGPDPANPFFKHRNSLYEEWKGSDGSIPIYRGIHFRAPFFFHYEDFRIQLEEFVLQTAFA